MLKIYEENATTFLNNGIATLHPHKALIYKEDNGDYYIEIESPVEDFSWVSLRGPLSCPAKKGGKNAA